jgi:hypothetical protein
VALLVVMPPVSNAELEQSGLQVTYKLFSYRSLPIFVVLFAYQFFQSCLESKTMKPIIKPSSELRRNYNAIAAVCKGSHEKRLI